MIHIRLYLAAREETRVSVDLHFLKNKSDGSMDTQSNKIGIGTFQEKVTKRLASCYRKESHRVTHMRHKSRRLATKSCQRLQAIGKVLKRVTRDKKIVRLSSLLAGE